MFNKHRWRRAILISSLVFLVGMLDNAGTLSITWLAYSFSLTFITVIVLALMFPISQALFWGTVQGLVLDIYSPSLFGMYMLSAVVLIIVVKWLRQTWFKQTSVLAISVVAVISLTLSYALFVSGHYFAYGFGLLTINPLAVMTWQGWLLGIVAQCLVINLAARELAIFQRFVLV